MNIEDYVTLNRKALGRLSDRDRIEVLGELTRQVPTWLSQARACEIDNLRSQLGSESAVAEHLGVERQALSSIGDGPVVSLRGGRFCRPRLLRDTAEILLEHGQTGPVRAKDLTQALQVLRRRGRPNAKELLGAAQRIARAADVSRDEMPAEQERTCQRGLAHAAHAAGL